MLDRSYIRVSQLVKASFQVAPVINTLESINLLHQVERLSGLGAWVNETWEALTPEERDFLEVEKVFSPFWDFLMIQTSQLGSFEEYIQFIENIAPEEYRDKFLSDITQYATRYPEHYPYVTGPLTVEGILNDVNTFKNVICGKFNEKPDSFWQEMHQYLLEPTALLNYVTHFSRVFWEKYLKEEWQRNEVQLQESVNAFSEVNLPPMEPIELIRAVTGRDMTGKMNNLEGIDEFIFIPHPHIGPYLTQIDIGNQLFVTFGARLPSGVRTASQSQSSLSRAELLTRLHALSDDTRLRILELLKENEEMYAQDIIEKLGLSQSSASRHLSQLVATGFVLDRRKDVAKCYSLNPDRMFDTLQALQELVTRL